MTIREELLQNNPFASTAAPNPWENSVYDIPSLNQNVSDQIFYLIKNKANSPKTPLAGLILGESGSGKTHMLKRILDRVRQDDLRAFFVSVKAFRAHERVMRNLWREIFVNLLRKRDGKISQFNFIVSKIMNMYRRSNAIKGTSRFDVTDGIRYFQNQLPEIHTDLLKAIFAYYDHSSDERCQSALRWLHGSSDDDHPVLLGVDDRNSMSAEALEEEAQKLILSLGLILDLCETPMVVCFDQLDDMEDPILLRAWGKAVEFLIDHVFSMLPLVFVKGLAWRKRFYEVLDSPVSSRLQANMFMLKNCTLDQARQLINSRIISILGEGANDKCKWLLEQLDGKLKDGSSPRVVLDLANHVLRYPDGIQTPEEEQGEILHALDREYRKERDNVATNFTMWPPDMERLRDALEIYLSHHQNFKAIKRPNVPYISLTGRNTSENSSERDCAFIINVVENSQTVWAAFRRGVSFLEKHPDGICYYITDERCIFRGPNQWKKVHAELDKLESLGGKTLFLDQIQAIDWYSLTELLSKVKSGDVTLLSSRAASMDDLKLYLEQGFKINLLEIKKTAASNTSEESVKEKKNRNIQPLNEDELVKNVSEFLKNSPMRSMKVEMLLGYLAGLSGNVTITRERLLEFLGGHGDKFSLYPTGDSTLVMLKL